MNRLFPTTAEFLADLERQRVETLPAVARLDWTGVTRPPRDPVERAFFERLGIPTRARELAPGEVPPRTTR
ncbi:MAG: hypothetical protein C0497_01005 [Gemmatimonas sp.]|nr:hypothetical protein [Gemmatimonas sp.]